MSCRRPRRLASFEYRGAHRYFVTCCTAQRQTVFVDRGVVDVVGLQIRHACHLHDFALLAYVFMPDHVHLLLEGSAAQSDFRRFMRVVRQRTTVAYHRLRSGALWQDGYYERVLRRADQTEVVIDYILANPIRAGLVANAVDYPYSWSVTLT